MMISDVPAVRMDEALAHRVNEGDAYERAARYN
jgi:hypothetical protein